MMSDTIVGRQCSGVSGHKSTAYIETLILGLWSQVYAISGKRNQMSSLQDNPLAQNLCCSREYLGQEGIEWSGKIE